MKHIRIFGLIAAALLAGSAALSCDVLEKVPGSDVTEDTIFSTKKDFESFLFGPYMLGLHSYYPYHNQNSSRNPNPTMCMTSPMSDESEMAPSWHASHLWNSAGIQKNSIVSNEDRRWNLRWEALRRANIIIERIDGTDFTATEKRGYLGEALFIRALNHFEIFKRYGGMPIVDKRFGVNDEWSVPRASVADYVEFMVKDCDDAARNLDGIVYNENQRGRINKTACLALKANRPAMLSDVGLYFADPGLRAEVEASGRAVSETEKAQGKLWTRTYLSTPEVGWQSESGDRRGLRSFGIAERRAEDLLTGEVSVERRSIGWGDGEEEFMRNLAKSGHLV